MYSFFFQSKVKFDLKKILSSNNQITFHSFFRQAFAFFVFFLLSMFVYVIRPEGFKYDLCENGTQTDDGSGLCMTFSGNVTSLDFSNATTSSILANLSLLETEVALQTSSPLDGKSTLKLIILNGLIINNHGENIS